MEEDNQEPNIPGINEGSNGPLLPDPNDWEVGQPVVQLLDVNNNVSENDNLVGLGFLANLGSLVQQVIGESQTTDDPSTSDNSSSAAENTALWYELPHVVLSELFSKLKDKDRISAGLVCKRWKDTLSDPSLWRTRCLRFTNSCVSGRYTQKVLGFARKYGQHLHRLSIQCMHPNYSLAKKFQSCMTSFLHALNTKRADNRRCELRELTINQLHIERYWRQESIRDRLVNAFCRFLKKQYKLNFCDFSEMTLTAYDGLKILDALGEGAGRHLKTLNMEDYFGSRLAIFAVPRYRLVMSSFHNLHSLITNYNYMSEDMVHLLTANCQHRLKNLSIKVYRLDPCRHTIHPNSWKLLRQACPRLRVCLYFEAIGSFSDLTRIACQEIPLKVIQIWTGMNYQEEYWRLSDTIRYLGKTFYLTLEEACFYMENGREEVDDALLYFAERCRVLEALDLQCVLMVPTINTICDWQEKYKIALQRCHIAADNLTGIEVDQLDAVVDKYRDMLDERGHDFQLLANPGF